MAIIRKYNLEFERKLLSRSCLIIMTGMILGAVFNITMKLDFRLILTTLLAVGIFFFLFLLVRSGRYLMLVKWQVSIVSLVLINMAWLTNYGSTGPTFLLLLLYLTYIVFIWDKPILYYFLLAVFFNLITMLSVELIHPEWLSGYSSRQSQILDLYLGLLIASSAISLFSVSIKQFFISQSDLLKKSDEQKGQLLRTISHLVRTPLNAIVGFSDLIDDDSLSKEEKQEFRENIWQNSKILTNIVDNIIDLSNIENERFKPLISSFNLVGMIDRATMSARKRKVWMGKKNLNIEFEKVIFNIIISSDEERLERVLGNLINHAIGNSDKGVVMIHCKTEDDRVFVTVTDTGKPILPDAINSFFDRFNQNNDLQLSNNYLSAIDLYLSYEIIRWLGGELSVQAHSEQGNSLVFWLPLSAV